MKLPTISSYCSDNVHALQIDMGNLTLYYSYTTIIAFRTYEDGRVVSENIWGPTTGKHINMLDGGEKNLRLNRDVFENKLHAVLVKFGLEDN